MPTAYQFGRFELRPLERRALADGQPLALGGRGLDVLLELVKRDGGLVTKEELLHSAWPGLIVEEANVHVQISLLRKALGAQAIATVAGLGYRFAMPITPVGRMPPQNLPAARNAFIGRAADLAAAEQQLQGTRLLTFIGIGGSGKTRLALRLAERVLPAFAQGTWFVDLAPLEEAAQVPIALARALGVAQGSDSTLEQGLLNRLCKDSALLVLDNGEHLLDAVAALAGTLLSGAPDLKILCTSREALRLPGEAIFAVRPLALPAPDADEAGMAAAESVQLFIDRACAAAPGLKFDAHEVRVAAQICRRLDGLPLALELAAARMKVLSVVQVHALLDERLRLLTAGQQALPRQQTLQAVIQWSYEHLAPAEQGLLRALSVCSGGCDLAAAVALQGGVADPLAVQNMATLDSLARLVDKSLLTVEHHALTARYLMLETVRQYALERLEADGEVVAMRGRHLVHFLGLAEEMERQLSGEEPGRWIARLDLDRDNLFRALAWCDRADFARLGLRLVVALRHYWSSRGLVVRGYEETQVALARPGTRARDLWRCRAESAAALQCAWMGHMAESAYHAGESLAIALEIDDGERCSIALRQLATACQSRGDGAAARAHSERALAVARQIGNEVQIYDSLSGLAILQLNNGEYLQAEPLFEEVLAMRTRLGHPYFSRATVAFNLASIAVSRRQPQLAQARLVEAAGLAERTESRYLGQLLVDEVAALAAMCGHFETAVCLLAASAQQRVAIRMPPHDLGPAQAHDHEAAREALGMAATSAAEQAGREMSFEQALAAARSWLRSTPVPTVVGVPLQPVGR